MKKYNKTIYCGLLLWLFATVFGDPNGVSSICSFRIAGFYPEYNSSELPVSQIRYDKLTDVIYFSIYPNSDGTLNVSSVDSSNQQKFVSVAHLNNKMAWISVGGASRSTYFSTVVADPVLRNYFADNLVQYCLTHEFDGIDLDWEPIEDPANYVLFIRELKTKMIPHSLKLSVDVYALGNGLSSTVFDAIDWLHVMAYHLHEDAPHSTYEDALAALENWDSMGFPRPKMILGLPFFGKDIDPQTINEYYPYKDIINLYHPSPDVDEVSGINFNGINTIRAKTKYVVENGYGGIMFWELTNDTTDETSLLTAAAKEAQASSPPDFNCDNAVDILDLAYFITDWLRTDCTADNFWCERKDLNASGTVDLSDLVVICQHWKHVLEGDINNDTHVDLEDAVQLSNQWLWEGISGSIPEDIYIDGRVDLKDLTIIAKYWLTR